MFSLSTVHWSGMKYFSVKLNFIILFILYFILIADLPEIYYVAVKVLEVNIISSVKNEHNTDLAVNGFIQLE